MSEDESPSPMQNTPNGRTMSHGRTSSKTSTVIQFADFDDLVKRSEEDKVSRHKKTEEMSNKTDARGRTGILDMFFDFFGLKVGRTDATSTVGQIVVSSFEEAQEKEAMKAQKKTEL